MFFFSQGTNDGSTEAAITLLTMGDLVLQSEISTEQSGGKNKRLNPNPKKKPFKSQLVRNYTRIWV